MAEVLHRTELDLVPSSNVDWSLYRGNVPLSFHDAQPALIASYALLWLIGVLGNLWVTVLVGYVLVNGRNRRRSCDAPLTVQIYVFSLCLFDLFGLAFLPLLILDLVYGSWTIPSSFLCKLYLVSEGFNKFGAPWLLTALSGFCCSRMRRITRVSEANASFKTQNSSDCINRRTRLSNQFKPENSPNLTNNTPIRKDSGRRAVFTVILFVLAVFLAMSPVLLYTDIYYVTFPNQTQIHVLGSKCAYQPPHNILTIFTIYSFIAGYLCPAFLYTYYYITILRCIRRQRGHWDLGGTLGRQSRDRYCRVAKTAIGLVSWTLAGWTPYWIILLYLYFNPQTDPDEMADSSVTIILTYFFHMLPYITCSGYPILYTVLNKNIRTAYAREKMACADRKRRKRLASMGTLGARTGVVGTNSSSSGSTRIPLRSSMDCSSCDIATQTLEETIRTPF